MDWYYREGGHRVGPVTDDAMRALIKSGIIGASTLVWREGMVDWTPNGQSDLADLQRTVSQSTAIASPVVVILLRGGIELARFEIAGTPLTLGSANDCDVSIQHASVSRHHARVSLHGETVYIEDLGSTNGTRVNGQFVTGRQPLKSGNSLLLGEWGAGISIMAVSR